MIRAANTLDALVAGLRGHLVSNADWQAVIALANHTLLTPALFSSLEQTGQIQRVPSDVRKYLQFIHDCNRERNMRLRAQLKEAVTALNKRGIVPVLLKGAVPLFLSRPVLPSSRMTSDLDIGVAAREEASAQACLEELGYLQVPNERGMARPQDAGLLELRPYRPHSFERPKLVLQNDLRVKVPSAQSRALHWILHDLVKEGDYLRGRIDLRHLHDLAQLAESDGIDWTALRASVPDRGVRNAIDTQLLAMHSFFGTSIPVECMQRPIIRLQHWRRVITSRHPVFGAPLRFAGNILWGARRLSRAQELARRDPVYLLRRIAIILLNGDLRSKI
ncbi:nucleotidyltransferase family protein [Rhizobium sp. ARZ01]|uniref:nucleotidyltransferase family protein n=1 Tax=Rhizobium sp. ARZ01 TaxID=2769313 RepID=UPI00177D5B91|nr:nucleotidyltransferase family protein [Rhizobium sp. ARZ01]MBD9373700.1 nucleotidyltransferase family protein [Rhizobium sp. ARZ01]